MPRRTCYFGWCRAIIVVSIVVIIIAVVIATTIVTNTLGTESADDGNASDIYLGAIQISRQLEAAVANQIGRHRENEGVWISIITDVVIILRLCDNIAITLNIERARCVVGVFAITCDGYLVAFLQ